VQLEGLGKLKKSIRLNRNRTDDLSACSIVLQLTTKSRAPHIELEVKSKHVCKIGLHSVTLFYTYINFEM
jgi:hypothetical protein